MLGIRSARLSDAFILGKLEAFCLALTAVQPLQGVAVGVQERGISVADPENLHATVVV